MAFIPAEKVVQVSLNMTYLGQLVQNTLYWQFDDPVTIAGMEALGTLVVAWWDVELAPQLSTQLTLNNVTLTDLSDETAPVVVWTGSLPASGTNSSPALPGNVAWVIKFNTLARGRSSRGRNYIVGLCEGNVAGNLLDVGAANFIVTAYEELMLPMTSPQTAKWVVLSRYENNAPRLFGLAREVTSVSYTDLVLDSQRRRLPGRGL